MNLKLYKDKFSTWWSFFGWRMVIYANLVDFVSVGLAFYAYAVFFGFIQQEFEASRFLVSSTVSVMILAAGIYSPIMGFILDKFPIKKLLPIGAIIFGSGFILLSFVQNFTQFLMVYGTFLALGIVIFGNLSTAKLISNWFEKKIGTALGYASIGLSLSGVIIPLIAIELIISYGWRNTYLIFGIFVLLICSFFSYKYIVDKPSDINQFPDNDNDRKDKVEVTESKKKSLLEIMSVSSFWVLTIIFTFQISANLGVYTHIPIFSQDLGYSPIEATRIYAVAAFCAALGKIIFGNLLDYLGARKAIWISLLCHGLGIAALIFSQSLFSLLFSVMFLGIGLGGQMPLMNSTFALTFGSANFGKARGLMTPFMVPMQIIAAPLSGFLYDTYGNYTLAFSINVVLCVIAGFVVFFLHLPEKE